MNVVLWNFLWINKLHKWWLFTQMDLWASMHLPYILYCLHVKLVSCWHMSVDELSFMTHHFCFYVSEVICIVEASFLRVDGTSYLSFNWLGIDLLWCKQVPWNHMIHVFFSKCLMIDFRINMFLFMWIHDERKEYENFLAFVIDVVALGAGSPYVWDGHLELH